MFIIYFHLTSSSKISKIKYMARRLSKQDIISNVYYNLESGFGSIQDTLKQAKEKDPSINRVDVANWLKQQPNKQIRRYRGSNSYTAPFARFEYQIDIMDMIPLTKEPEVKIPKKKTEPRYGLVVIDIFSKLANVVPMENKDGESVLTALKESFKKMGFPMSIYSDDDGAFKTVVGQFFKDEGINHIITLTHANVVERFIRTMKNMIHDRVRFNKGSWTTLLPQALAKYNSSKHSSTKMTPKEAHDDKNHMDVRVNLTRREKNTRKYPEINVNDKVKVFQKGRGNYTDRKEYVSKWTTQTYKVKEIKYDSTGNKNFILDGLNKPYLRHEILKV